MGDVQCANVTILDDTTLSGQRNLSIRLTNHTIGEGGSRVKINDSMPSVDIIIDDDSDDSKYPAISDHYGNNYMKRLSPRAHTGVMVGFSQLIFTASEDEGFVQICAELLEGELETNIFLLIEVFANDSGRKLIQLLYLEWSISCKFYFYSCSNL